MSSLIFKKLYIFHPEKELAKIVELRSGLNVITSVRKDGNDLGKSLIAKSFYHCLGADCFFDTKFEVGTKVFVVVVEYEDERYLIYRSSSLFKMFDSDMNLLWSTSHRHELGKYLYECFGFAIWLPTRETNKIEITPPAYSFAPYFIDQNKYDGSSFSSFGNLSQYKNYKENLIYTFTGAYDEEYFKVKAEKEPLESQLKEVNSSISINAAMSERIAKELSGLGYSADMATLEKDCEKHESEYKKLSGNLSTIRNRLYSLREKSSQLKLALEGAKALGRHLDKSIDTFSEAKCPICNSDIEDPFSVRVAACVTYTDVLLLSDEFQKELDKTQRSIASEEKAYSQALSELEALKRTINAIRQDNLNAVQIEGLIKLNKNLTDERGLLEIKGDRIETRLNEIDKKLRDYTGLKSDVTMQYIETLTSYVEQLNLQSVDMSKVKNVSSRFKADGSNAPLATVAWYFALLRLKEEFNPSRVNLPLILDSPMNVEADNEKYETQYGLIFDTFKYQHQMIVTGLGLANAAVVPEGANIVVLENEKYHLLNNDDFETEKELLFTCMEA